MKIKLTLIVFFLIAIGNISAQESLNGYKYVKIPEQFNFLKSADKYQLNSLAKFLFEKEGFSVLFDNEKLPDDLYANPCLGLNAKVLNDSGMFSTKLHIELYNCKNELIFKSTEGRSKIKEYKKAYHAALRKAFESIKETNYSYDASLVKSATRERLVEKEKLSKPIVAVAEEQQVKEDKIEDKVINVNKPIEKVDSKVIKEVPIAVIEDKVKSVLYAQKTTNGFQLVDSTPKIVYKLLKTSQKDFYILKGKDGVVLKKDDNWFVEYYENEVLVIEKLNIKF